MGVLHPAFLCVWLCSESNSCAVHQLDETQCTRKTSAASSSGFSNLCMLDGVELDIKQACSCNPLQDATKILPSMHGDFRVRSHSCWLLLLPLLIFLPIRYLTSKGAEAGRGEEINCSTLLFTDQRGKVKVNGYWYNAQDTRVEKLCLSVYSGSLSFFCLPDL